MRLRYVLLVIFLVFVIAGVLFLIFPPKADSPLANKDMTNDQSNKKKVAVLETSLGIIKFEFYSEDAPNTVANFVKLAKEGFYDNLVFHRVVPGFVVQAGDPNCGIDPTRVQGPCGAGGPGYKFDDEINPTSDLYRAGYVKGIVAMANSGPNTNGSQFFIMLKDNPLPPNYTIFGKVVEGQEVVDAIGEVQIDDREKPLEDVIIKKASIVGEGEKIIMSSDIILKSSAFAHNSSIPSKYTCDGEDISPPLLIENVPQSAKSLVLIVDDPDAPSGTFDHWVVWNISPNTKEIKENSIPQAGEEGITDFGRAGYGGPCPPSGEHRYMFKLYALDDMLNLPRNAKKEDVERVMEGHILAQTTLVGLYKRK